MAITKGHLIFAVVFAVVFLGIIAWQYIRDYRMHKQYYKGAIIVILGIIGFIILFMYLKNQLITFR
jgi:hypothetical protein